MGLSECITDYDSFFEDLGFPKEAVRNGDVRIIKSNSRYITISYGDKLKEIEKGRLEKYKVTVQTKCVVLKIKALWNSSENNLYGLDKESHKTYTRIISGTIKNYFSMRDSST